MPDVKEVINGLEMSYKYSNVDENNTLVPQWIVLHAIALLKAQEPVEPTWRRGLAFCGKCGRQFGRGFKYCPDCGMAVKWDD